MVCGDGMERACGLPPDHVFKPNSIGLVRSKGEKELEKGLLERRVVWTEDLWEDYWIYLKNNHVILGILLCHVLDPFSRWERLTIFVCGLFWSILSASTTLEMTNGVSAEQAEVRRVGYAILYGLVVYIFTSLMKRFALCGAGTCFERCWGFLGHLGMFIGVLLASGMLILAIFLAIKSPYYDAIHFWESFIISQVVSWISGFFLGFLAYYFARRSALKKKEQEALNKKESKCTIS